MHADARKLLWDAQQAAERIARFIADRGFTDYEADEFLRSAVERQFEVIGEALNHLAQVDPQLASQIADLPRIVAFRNVLIRGVDNKFIPAGQYEAVLIDEGHDCEFRAKLDTDSAANWTVIPAQTGHGFRGKLDS